MSAQEFLYAKTGIKWDINEILIPSIKFSGKLVAPLSPDLNETNRETSELRVGTRLLEYRLLIQLNNTKLKSAHTFSYVEGSQRWFNMFDLIIRRAVYHAGLSCTQDRRTQMLYFNLPKLFRRRCELGFDLIETQTKSWQFLRHTDEKNLKQAVLYDCDGLFSQSCVTATPDRIEISFRPSSVAHRLTVSAI